jgi:ABC-type Fe3+ transport system permease subunit
MLATALLFAVLGGLAGHDSTFIWLDVGVCLILAAILFLAGSSSYSAQYSRSPRGRAREVNPHRWRDTALILSAVITIFSPAVKFLVELSGAALPPAVGQERECSPAEPPVDDQPQ